MATVTKNFRIKSGLVVEGTTGTIGGHNILTESTSGDQYILNLIGGETLVKSVDTNVFNVDGAGNLTVNANTFDSYGSASAAQSAAATDATNKANQALADAQTYANSLASNYDAAGSAATAESNANTYTSSRLNDYTKTSDLDVTIDGYGYLKSADLNGYATEAYADQAEIDAKAYADSLINDASATSTNIWSAYKTSTEIGLAQAAAELHADNAVAALVDGAPALLDTLNELAAAIADNPSYATDVANLVATKADTTYVNSEISNLDTAAQGYASTAQAAAEATASADATTKANAAQAAAEATASAALNDILDATTPFTDLNINDVAKQVASRVTSLGSVAVTAYEFNKTNFKSGKFLIKIDNGTNNEVSEILVTLDSSDNIAITEYAIVGTNGSRGTITADVYNSHARIRVTPVDDSTITVAGTVFNA